MFFEWFAQLFTKSVFVELPFIFEQLEERVVLDASVAATVENQVAEQSSASQGTGGSSDADASPTADTAASTQDHSSTQDTPEQTDTALSAVATETTDNALVPATVESTAEVRVLVVSSSISDAELLASAAQENVITITYDSSIDTLGTLLAQVQSALGDQKAESIAFATHDLGEGRFVLTDSYSVSPSSLAGSEELQAFWHGVGDLLAENGRIDLLICDLASTDVGTLLISQLETLTGHTVAASDDPVGNASDGGDWILETDEVDAASIYFVQSTLSAFEGILAGEDKLTVTDGSDTDQLGYSVSISGDYAVVGALGEDVSGLTDAGAAYIYHRETGTSNWTLVTQLTASDPDAYAGFGRSVAISGDYVIVGEYYADPYGTETDEGAAYVFMRDEGGTDNWGLVTVLLPSVHSSGDHFGYSVAISEDYVVVGAKDADYDGNTDVGLAFVFYKDEGGTDNWGQVTLLEGSDSLASDYFGTSVAISGDYIIVGAPNADIGTIENAGAAYILEKDEGGADNWGEEAKLVAADAGDGDKFGYSVAISEDCAIVGAPYDTVDGIANAGSAYTFFRDYGGTDTWGQTQKLVSSTTQTYGTGFGWSVSISGDYAAISAWHQDVGSATDAGAVCVFLRNYGGNDNWGEVVVYEASDSQKDDILGFSVAISGTDIIAGAPHEDEQGSNAGAAYIFSGSLDVAPEILPGDVPTVSGYEDQTSDVFLLAGRDANTPEPSDVHFVIQDENGDYQVIDNSGTSSITVAQGTITFLGAVACGEYRYTQAFTFTPDENYSGEFDISYYFASTDGTQSDVMTFHVVVKPVNDSPVILESEVPSVTVDEDETSLVFTLTAYDEDNDDASSVNFVVDGQTISNSGGSTVTVTNGVLTALGGVVSDGNGKYTQQFTFTPDADYTGLVSLSYYFKTPAPASSDEDGQTLGSESRTCVALGDVDGDGDVDIVLGGGGSTAIWLNDGTGTFSDSGQSLDASDTQALALGDVDGDGDIDIVQGTGSYTKIWLNDGTGVFSDSGQSLASSGANALALGDVDGNGYLDLVVADGNGIKLWLNDGSGTFYSSGRSFASGEATAVALGDMDGDGDLDIVANNGGRLHVNLNNGSGWFTKLSTPNSSTADCIVLDDLDGDGDLDIVEGRNSSNARIWLNNGTGTGFTSYSISDFSWSWCVATLDVNGDGYSDLFLGGRTFINDGTGQSYTLSQSLAASASVLGAASADLDGDGWDDLVTAAQNQVWLTVTEMEKSSSRILEITVNPVNDAPVLADTNPTLSPLAPNETNSSGDTVSDIVVDGSVTDVDVAPATSAPQAIAVTWVDNTNGYWEYSTDGGATWTRFSDIHGSGVDLSTNAVLLDQSDQSRIRFVPDTDWHGNATFQYRAWDETEGTNGGTLDATNNGGTTALSSFVETATITVNEAPVLSDLDGTMVYTENSGAQVIDADITLSDGDSDTIISATVQITGNYQSGEDLLSIADEDLLGGVSATWNETTGTLTLTGSTTKANYESMLEHITYTNSSDAPTTLDRTVSWAVNDGFHESAVATSTIDMVAVNDAPILALSHSAGGLDSTFGDDGIVITDIHTSSGNFVAFCTVIQADGKIVVGGEDGHDSTLVRYNSDGSLDTTFGDDGIVTTNIAGNDRIYGLAIQSDGKIVAVGRSQDSGEGEDFSVARYNSDGSLDTTFSGDGIVVINNWTYQNDTAYAVAIDSDGNIVVVGRKAVGSGQTDFYVIRLDENGDYDTSFSSDGKVSTNLGSSDIAYGVALQDDGKVVIVGTTGSNVAVLRYNSDGSLDTTFSGDGIVTTNLGGSNDCGYSVAIQSDGKIVVAGSDGEDCVILRYNSDGTLDDTFGDDGVVTTDLGGSSDCGYSVAIDSDGRIVVTGVTDAGSSKDFFVVRYDSDGSLDETFNGTGVVTTDVSDGYSDVARAVALQSDGLIVVAGYANNGTHNEFAVARYGTGGPAEYTEGDPPIVLENTITLSDVDNTDMTSATIQITANYQEGADTLGIDEAYLVSGVTVNWNAVTGTLTLSGLASKADYESMLEHVTYENTSDDPSTSDRTVTWIVYDGADSSGAQTSTVTVSAVNDPPEGTDNTITINEDTTYTLTVADFGVSDTEGDELVSLTITQLPSSGTLQLNGVDVTLNQVITRADVEAGALTFTPAPDANGVGCDSFQFAVTDDGGTAYGGQDTDQTPNTITFDVTPVDDADPIAGADSFTTTEDDAMSGTVAGNDSVGVDTPATWSKLIDPSNGTLAFNADGTFTYTPNADFNGTDSFTYTLKDSDGETATATVTITVTPVNDAPEGTDNTITINEDTTYTLTLADFGFSDIDGDEFACVHITELPTAGELQLDGAAVTLNQVISIADIDAGKLTFTPDADANGVGCDSFQFAVTDDGGTANGGQDTDQTPNTITFDVTPVDDDDPTAGADSFTAAEDNALSGTVADNDSVGGDGPATWSKLSDPSNGTVVFNDDGTFTYTPNADFNGTDSFTYTLTDSDGETATATVTITVTPVGDAPSGTDNTITMYEDGTYTLTVADFGFTDVDGDNFAYVQITELPASGTLELDGVAVTVDQLISTADIDAGKLTFTPDANANGNGYASFQFAVIDDSGDPAGTPDTSFGGGDGVVTTGLGGDDRAYSAAIQSDGKIVVAGFSSGNFAVVRYNADGSLDTGFGGGDGVVTTGLGGDDRAYSVAIQSDGKIVVAGYSDGSGTSDFALVRYNADGSLDTSFGGGDGVVITNLGGTDSGYSVAIQSDGKIVVAGYSDGSGTSDFALVRYNADGTLDTSFGGGDGIVITNLGGTDYGRSVAIQSDGKIVVAGFFDGSGPRDFALARYNADGSLDTSFGGGDGIVITNLGATEAALSVIIQSDGKIVVAGYSDGSGTSDFALVRYNADGSLDTSFGGGDGVVITGMGGSDIGYSVAIQEDGKIVVAGFSGADFAVARYNADGSLDTTFSDDGKLTTDMGGSDYGSSVVIQSDGKIVVAGYSGADFAVARYTDCAQDTDLTPNTIIFDVIPVDDDDPIAEADSFTTDEDTEVSGTVADNDSVGVDTPATWSKVTDPSNGTLVLNADGTFTYTPNADFNGTDSFTYTLTDSDGETAIGTVTITVTPVDDTNPSATDDSFTTTEDTELSDTVADNDSVGVDTPATWSKLTDPSHGTLVFNDDGTFTYTPHADFNGTDSFTYMLTDSDGETTTGTVTITVTPVDDADPTAEADAFTTAEDTAVSDSVAGNDSVGVDTPATWSKLADPSHGTLVFNDDGTFTYTPHADFNGTDSFTYTLTDSDGETTTATVTITVTPVDDADPTAGADTFTTTEDTPLDDSVAGNDSVGVDTPATWSAQTDPSHGTLAFNDDGTFTYTPHADFNGTDSFTYMLTDSDGESVTATVTITVTPVDDAPSDLSLSNNSVAENAGVDAPVGTLSATDPDSGETFTYTLVSGEGDSGNSFFNISGDTLRANDSFDYETEPTAYSIRVQVTDSTGLTREEKLTINVTNVNEAPVLSDLGETLACTENDPATVIDNTITLTDVDNEYLSSATIQITGNYLAKEDVLGIDSTYLVDGISASWDASTGTLTLTGSATIEQYESMLEHVTYSNSSDNPQTADRTVSWTVNDGSANAVSQTSTITVAAVNDAPQLSDCSDTVVYTADTGAQILDADLSIQDPDNTTISCATICITGNYVGGTDVLGIDSSHLLSGVTANWDSASGTLTLSGYASKADYQSMLEHVTYATVSDAANTGDRVVTWRVSDGQDYSEANTTIRVLVVESPPVPHEPHALTPNLPHDSETSAPGEVPSARIGNVLTSLPHDGSLPSFPTGELMRSVSTKALLADTSEERYLETDGGTFRSGGEEPREQADEPLGLESFFKKLRDWKAANDFQHIRLAFNADEIHLCEWFDSPDDLPHTTGDSTPGTQISSSGWLNDCSERRSIAINIDELRVIDLL